MRKLITPIAATAALAASAPAQAEVTPLRDCLDNAASSDFAAFDASGRVTNIDPYHQRALFSLSLATIGTIVTDQTGGPNCPCIVRVTTGLQLGDGPRARKIPPALISAHLKFTNLDIIKGQKEKETAKLNLSYTADCERVRRVGRNSVTAYMTKKVSYTYGGRTILRRFKSPFDTISCSTNPASA